MGDRNNPIKFGPEWLRNLSRERNAASGNTTNSSQNTGLGSLLRERYTASPNTASSNQSNASRPISRERAVTTDNTTNNSQNISLGAIPRERNATSANTTNNNQNTALGTLARERNATSTNHSQNSTSGNILRVRNLARANNTQASLGAIPRERNTTSTNTVNSNSNTALGTRERNAAITNTVNSHQNTVSGTVSHERNATNANSSQNIRVGSSSAAGATGAAGTGGLQSNSTTEPGRENQSLSQNTTRVQLAKLRYGREEMLALYDRNIEPPSELRNMEILFKARGHQPAALANTFEERENIRNVQPSGVIPSGERTGLGRGYLGRGFMGRGASLVEGRGRGRGSFIRQPSVARSSWHSGNPRMPLYNANIDEETTPLFSSWNNSNNYNPTSSGTRNNGDGETAKIYRNRRPGNTGNWRQVSREDSEEWRSGAGRSRPQEKWDWGERSTTDKGQSWNPNRRTWVGGEVTNVEDNLPEWAVDNAGACGGTFDSTGAFHGYSNDDSNLPRSQDNAYPLTRSHTHGSFVRQRTVEEGSEEWWDSEKAKKLSPKRFNAGDINFKKAQAVGASGAGPSGVNKSTVNDDNIYDDVPVRESDTVFNYDESSQVATGGTDKNGGNSTYAESKTFDSLMRSDINIEEANDERGNFQSVMITANNRLRKKHQNIVLPINEAIKNMNRKQAVLQLLRAPNKQATTSSVENTDMENEDNIVDDILELTIQEKALTTTASPLLNVASTPSGMPSCFGIPPPMHRLPNPMQMGLQNQSLGLSLNQNNKPTMRTPVMQPSGAQSNLMQQVGITNSALNASLGLPLVGANLGIPHQGVPPPVLPNPGMGNSGMGNAGMGANAMQGGTTGLPGYPNPLSRMSASEVGNNSLFMGQNSNNLSEIQAPNGFQLHNNARQNMFSVHGLQQSQSQTGFGNWNSNMMPQSAAQPPSVGHSLADQWYYEDPKQVIQGPFSSQEMFSWYRAGFFTSSLMVRRACDAVMRPLGSYGPIVPFAQLDMRQYQLPSDNMLNNQQSGLGLGVINISNMNPSNTNPVDTVQFGTVDMMRNPPYGQNPMVDSLWSQPTAPTDLMWMQHVINSRNENRVNNLPMYFWDQQPSAISSNSMLPEDIHKEMKTEDQILAQLRASQNISTSQTLSFMNIDQQCPETSILNKSNDNFNTTANVTPNLDELQKLIQKETLIPTPPPPSELLETVEQPIEATVKSDTNITETAVTKPATVTKSSENKTLKQAKNEGEKVTKKTEKVKNEKTKKIKEEKKEVPEIKVKEKGKDETDTEKRSAEPSPSKSKKEEKVNKKDLEKEKKELIKDGFTIVKGSEKNVNKDNKKKAEEDLKAAEEIERKKKDEEKVAAAEEKKKKQLEASKKLQEQQQQKQVSELVMKKAPWSAVSTQATQATNKDAITLAEIQRLEREKKLEQIKEQQHMMHIIAQQQAAALARDQEIQAGLNWAKKKPANNAAGQQTSSKIQAETRKQAVTSVATTMQGPPTIDESQVIVQTANNHIPWGNNQNGGGFWDTQPSQNPKPEKSTDSAKTIDANKTKKKPNLTTITKKETSPAAEFESWCSSELISWSSKIDVPTFVGFLKDIESPYEVKDYVKCYLGESKDSSDFARHFLERRSKLLRVGMVTPSDDLCSPAIAVNPRTVSGSDYQEIKSKGKKIKKNKMQKIDSRILGFSVTAAEDRINVGDIDTV